MAAIFGRGVQSLGDIFKHILHLEGVYLAKGGILASFHTICYTFCLSVPWKLMQEIF